MNSARNWILQDNTTLPITLPIYPPANERKILKAVLLGCLHQLFLEIFQQEIYLNKNQPALECYEMDKKIIQIIIKAILNTEEYTPEGIAYHTRIPLDVINEAASGINNQLSITPWVRVIALFMQSNPDIGKLLIEKLLELKNNNCSGFSLLLHE